MWTTSSRRIRTTRLPLSVTLAPALFALAGCGGDDSGGEEFDPEACG